MNNYKQTSSDEGLLLGIFGFGIVAVFLAYLAFQSGDVITAPPVKSGRELCKERGGVYIVLRSGPNRCFTKEAFK